MALIKNELGVIINLDSRWHGILLKSCIATIINGIPLIRLLIHFINIGHVFSIIGSVETMWCGSNLGVEQLASLSRSLGVNFKFCKIVGLLSGGQRFDRPWGG